MKTAGFLLIALGVLAILFPYVVALSYNFVLAFLLIAAGAGHFWWIWRRSFEGRRYHFLLALLYLGAGAALFIFPSVGVVSFTILAGAAFIAHGAVQLAFATMGNPASGKWMLTASGLLGVVVGFLIFAGLPDTATWVVGTLAGVHFIFFGAALLALARTVRVLTE